MNITTIEYNLKYKKYKYIILNNSDYNIIYINEK